jgi:hypothetical protein
MAHHGEALICFDTEAITRAATILESSEPALQRHIATYTQHMTTDFSASMRQKTEAEHFNNKLRQPQPHGKQNNPKEKRKIIQNSRSIGWHVQSEHVHYGTICRDGYKRV